MSNALPFSTSENLQVGSPNTIFKVLGNGLYMFLAEDGNTYLMDVRGGVKKFSDVVKLGSSSIRLSFKIGEASYYSNNLLQADGSPGQNAAGTSVITIPQFVDSFVSMLSIGGVMLSDGAFTWDPSSQQLSVPGYVFSAQDEIVVVGDTKSSGGGSVSGGSIVADINLTAVANQRQFPLIPNINLRAATNTLVFYNLGLIDAGDKNNQYQNTPQSGFITLNWNTADGDTVRIIGYTL